MANDAPFVSRPTLTDIDPELLRSIFAQETRYFQQNCTAVDSSASRPCTSPEEEGDSLLIKVANCLLRHGDGIKKVHSCFKQLTPRQYLVHVKPCQMEPDNFTVVTDDYRRPYSGSETPEVTNKESGSQLHPQELEIYECALFAAQYPVLANPDDSLDITVRSTRRPSEVSDLSGESLSPASKECMSYGKDQIRRSSVFEIESEDLIELVRQAFCLSHRRHEYYLREMDKMVNGDPANVLVKEMRELQLIFNSDCHPYFNVDLFRRREDYDRWLKMEKETLENIIRDREKHVKAEVPFHPTETPLVNKDKHAWFKQLIVKLFRAESVKCKINVGTGEAIPKQPLSAVSLRLLDEFGERYRIGFLYRRVCLLEYIARNTECTEWFCRYVITVIESILEFGKREGCIVRKDEIEIVRTAMTYLHGYVEHILSRINKVFQRNMPEGRLSELIRVLEWLVIVDHDDTFGEHNGVTVRQFLKRYCEEEMQRNYEKQKIIIAYQLRLASFGQQLTPRMVNRLILDISQDIRNYKMYFKKEFIDYFDIVQIAVEVFYRLLMEDILRLCDIHPVNQQHQDIDYLMIALAYRLTTFDQDPTWEHYLTLEGQIWRPAFLKHSLVWISSLHRNLQNLICKALQDDTWTGLHVDDSFTFVSAESTGSQSLRRSQQGSRPREIPSPLTGPSRGITPSHNSAFVQVPGRSASAIEKEFTNKVIIGDSSTSGAVQQSSTANDDVANQPGRRDVEVPIETNKTESSETTRPKIPSKSSTSNLLKYVQSTQYLASSHASLSSDSVYTDARSNTSDVEDYTSCNEDEENEQVLETSHLGHITVPISSSLIDTLSGVNRLIDVVRHFLHLLCPKKTSTRYDSLRISPEDGNEIYEKLEQGRVDMVKMLGDMIESLALFYGYYIISCESCGMDEEVLEPIIGQRCSTRSSTLFQDLGVRPCRHRTAGLQRCNSADSQGNCATSCVSMSRIENNTSQSERVVEEMCVRLNNVQTMKNLLTTLIENAVQNVLFSSPDVECNLMSVSDMSNTWSSVASTSHENNPPSSPASLNAMPTDVIDKNSIERTLEELQEIEDGLVKIMAYRANDVIKKLLQLLLSLNLRSFNARKRLRPVLNATRKTLHMLSSNLYPDCYAAVLRHFWLAIVEDFAEEKDKLIFLSVTAMEQAKLQLEAISYFIEIFRAEEDSIPLAFVSTTIEPIQKTLNHYTLPTANLRTMYEALEQRNASAVRISDSLSTRYRYQRPPSGILIQRLRIELHSENPHFSGQRFVECVSDRIRLEGNLSLGVCAVPDGGDEASGKALGEYLLHEEILVYVGKLVAETENESDDELDAEVGRYAPERGIIIPGGRKRPKIFNGVYIFGPESAETRSSLSADGLKSDNKIITREEGDTPQHFCDSENVLYKFKSSDFEESLSSLDPENYIDQGDNDDQKDIITVLFTRRNIERDAKTFLDTHETTCVVEELQDKIKRNTTNCCWPSAPLLPVN